MLGRIGACDDEGEVLRLPARLFMRPRACSIKGPRTLSESPALLATLDGRTTDAATPRGVVGIEGVVVAAAARGRDGP